MVIGIWGESCIIFPEVCLDCHPYKAVKLVKKEEFRRPEDNDL